jgi:hypothetical protein
MSAYPFYTLTVPFFSRLQHGIQELLVVANMEMPLSESDVLWFVGSAASSMRLLSHVSHPTSTATTDNNTISRLSTLFKRMASRQFGVMVTPTASDIETG